MTGKVGFGAKFMAKINELSSKAPEEKAQMQADLNSALKGNLRGYVDNSSVSLWNQPQR